ncbi:MAG: efflux RND transporter permease subunit [Deltaproteobacteria bacterium]|nr:efflux RND transporter permease subunit [Deltaproteobacteria bacterium]
MNISALCIQRPVMTTLVMLAILFFGVIGYRSLPVSNLPNVDFPTIQVTANLPGASPETMAAAVATPLEKQFSTIAGIDSMTSTSSLGTTNITLQFALQRDIDAAALDVQTAISAAQRQLPAEMTTPPSFRKVNPADQAILIIALTSPTLPLYALDEYGQTLMAQRISMVSGVAQVQVLGTQKYAVRMQLDPNALASRQLGIDEVSAAVSRQNVNIPTGALYGPDRALTIQADGQIASASAYRSLIVAYRNNQPVRLQELGKVIDGVENDKVAAWLVDQRSIALAVQRQPGSNTVEVARRVRNLLPALQEQLPASVSVHILFDRSEPIQESAHDVQLTLLLTLGLVVLVIFLFLRNFSATLIPSLALPLSLMGTFAVMHALGYSMDNLSLMALTLSVGFVVDDAIVMLENIVRHQEMGEGLREAALNGSREIGFTILSMTLSLAAVFIPVLFMGGILGRLFREFSVTIATAILISGFISLTLTPMMCSRFMRPPSEIRHGRLYLLSERLFNAALDFYKTGLRWSLSHLMTVMVFSGMILAATVYLFATLPKGFLPSEDTGQINAFTEAAQGTSFELMKDHQQAVAAIVRQDPNVSLFISSVGAVGTRGSNNGALFIRLKPRSERELSADQVIAQLRRKVAGVQGMQVFLQNPPPINLGGQLTKSPYQYSLYGTDTEVLYSQALLMEQKMRGVPGLTSVTSDLQIKNPQLNLKIDRDKAATLGVTPEQIETALFTAYGTRQISTIYTATNQYRLLMELAPEFQQDRSGLSLLYVRSSNGNLVPLDSVAASEPGYGPLAVNHTGQLPSVTLSFNLEPGASLGTAVSAIERLAATTLPATVSKSFQGTAQVFQSSLEGMNLLLIMAILFIYLVLGILYESFIHPLTILSALPFAGFGALVTLLLFRMDLTIYAFVGVIMLVGLVKKNGIMMVDFAIEAERKDGKSPAEAIFSASVIRFRPIMMTTMAALMGTLPIALGLGAGAESRRPLGLAVVGGLLFSQFLTLYATPVFYVLMARLQSRLAKKSSRKGN